MRPWILAVSLALTLVVPGAGVAAQGGGALALTSTVSGVEVWVDEQRLGEARAGAALLVQNVQAGTHRIFARRGSRTWERAVEVGADKKTEVAIVIDLPGGGPGLKLMTEVAAHVDTSYVTQPDFAQFRLGALRGMEKLVPEGTFAVAETAQGAAVTYRGPPPGGNIRVLFGSPTSREDTLRDLAFVYGIAREIAPKTDAIKLEQAMAQDGLAALDPHSSFLDRDSYREMRVDITGTFAGVGMEVTRKDDALSVVAPIDGTPAHRAGIQTGDRIVTIDGTPTDGMTLPDAIKRIRGKQGTKVVLGILREGWGTAHDVSLVREQIRVHSVQSRELEPGIGYIKIRQFQEKTAEDLEAVLNGWLPASPLDPATGTTKNGRLQGLVLDLRNNPGGLLTAAVGVAEKFLEPNRLVVYTQGRLRNQNIRFHAAGKTPYTGLPVVVLVNGGSASASEIVAGALQDWKVAALVGNKTFGKGSVQTIIPLSDGAAVRLTTARYFTPKGRSIDNKGLEPETVVAQADANDPAASDPQLDRAVAQLKTLIGSKTGHRGGS